MSRCMATREREPSFFFQEYAYHLKFHKTATQTYSEISSNLFRSVMAVLPLVSSISREFCFVGFSSFTCNMIKEYSDSPGS